jgi:hypothetical protein
LTFLFGIDGCLYMGPVADVLSLIFTVILLKLYWKKIYVKKSDRNATGKM